MNYLIAIKNWFISKPLKERLIFSMLGGGIFLLTLTMIWWVLSPSYTVLFSRLNTEDANQIIHQLEQEKTPYRLSNHGQDILVNTENVDKTRLRLMGSNVQIKGNVGFELFDQNDFGMTDFSRKINYQRALQGELERTIASLDEVRQARVHLVMPEEHLFQEDNKKPRAAVNLKLKNPLSRKQIRSIQQFIAASVPHLSRQDIVIVDQNGNNLTGFEEENSLDHLTFKKNVEHYLSEKVSTLLHNIFPANQMAVIVDVSLNYDELQRESIIPQHDGHITHEKEVRHSSQDKTKKNNVNEDVNREKNFQYGTEKERFKRASGSIEHMSISVALPSDTNADVIARVEKLVKATTGFNSSRGDVISVEAIIMPHQLPSILPSIKVNNKAFIPFRWLVISLACLLILIMSTAIVKQIRYRKTRRLLLNDLSQWLQQPN